MSVHRIMGIETEYGILSPHNPNISPEILSAQVVNAYAELVFPGRQRPFRWDYNVESPFNDLRYAESLQHPDERELWSNFDLGIPNLMLTNGARLYVDHAHPEYSTPEVTNPRDAALWDLAGEVIMRDAAQKASELSGNLIVLYKNNTDGKGASYGTHENYQVLRSVPFENLVKHLTSFFVTRNIWAGSGRVGIGQGSEQAGFQISQRADFFEARVGIETTINRPIINTRDEPHADAQRYRRLHVIVGDANLSPAMTFLKMGATSLILSMIEADFLDDVFDLADPVREITAVSRDYSMGHLITLADGQQLSALAIQRHFYERAVQFVALTDPDEQTLEVLTLWESVLSALEVDQMSLAGTVDWVTKLQLLESFRERDGLDWSSSKLQAIDLQFCDIRPEKGLARIFRPEPGEGDLFTEAEIGFAVHTAPADTRAFLRGQLVQRFAPALIAASWETLIFQAADNESRIRVSLPDASRLGSEEVSAVLSGNPNLYSLLSQLGQLTMVEY